MFGEKETILECTGKWTDKNDAKTKYNESCMSSPEDGSFANEKYFPCMLFWGSG